MNKFLRVLFILVIIARTERLSSSHSSILYGKSFGIWCFCRLATGDWDLECGGPRDPDCGQSQIRLVLSSDGSIGLDRWWVWERGPIIFQLFSLSSAGQWDLCA